MYKSLKSIGRFSGLLVVALFCSTASAATAYDTLESGWNGNTFPGVMTGDVWSFYCPKGGTYSVSVDTESAEVHNLLANRTNLDPYVRVFDGAGTHVAETSAGGTCTVTSSNNDTVCPAVADDACGVGTRHYIQVHGASTTTGGGHYRLTVTAKDAAAVALTDKQIKLGGGAKPKLPKFMNPDGTITRPISDDASLFVTP